MGRARRMKKNWAWPSTRATGRKTTMVVSVDMVMARAISPAPLMAASRREAPSWRKR